MTKMPLPDVNVWLALIFDEHSRNPSARAWFDGITDEAACFCRITQQGFLRLANNPSFFPTSAVSAAVAWQLYDITLGDPRVAFVQEPAHLEIAWRAFTQAQSFFPKLWNDAYLAAFAQLGGYEIVTFDGGFAQYAGVAVTYLT